LKLRCDEPLSNFAFKFNLRRCIMDTAQKLQGRHKKKHVFPINLLVSKVGRCRLTVSKPELKAFLVQRFKLKCDEMLLNCAFNFNVRRYTKVPGGGGADDVNFMGIITNRKDDEVGRCRLTVSKLELKACLETKM
jgi:hypothetical protein